MQVASYLQQDLDNNQSHVSKLNGQVQELIKKNIELQDAKDKELIKQRAEFNRSLESKDEKIKTLEKSLAELEKFRV